MGDIFSAIGILLVFATVALDFIVKDANLFLQKDIPDKSKTTEISKYKNNKNEIIIKLLLVLIFYFVLFWLLIPKSITILSQSNFDMWDFDLLSTFYVLINFCILIFVVLTFNYFIRTIQKK